MNAECMHIKHLLSLMDGLALLSYYTMTFMADFSKVIIVCPDMELRLGNGKPCGRHGNIVLMLLQWTIIVM